MKGIIQIQHYPSPCGELLLGSYEDKLCLCDWPREQRREAIDKRIQHAFDAHYAEGESEVIAKAIIQLNEYFSQERTTFDIPLLFAGTDFQQRVWNELLQIPYGSTASYAELSRRLGTPKAIRAVAAANGANAISLFVPCHRIIGTNRQLIGYAGGLPAKKQLLELEATAKSFF